MSAQAPGWQAGDGGVHEAEYMDCMTGSTAPRPVNIIVVMGVSGAGKSTVANLLAHRLNWPMLEGDDLHDDANLDKMSAGIALDDADRLPWLRAIAAWIDTSINAGASAIVTCSALHRSYRDILRRPEVTFVHLDPPRAQLELRLRQRKEHFMPPTLLASQLEALEPLGRDEQAITVCSGTAEEQCSQVIDLISS